MQRDQIKPVLRRLFGREGDDGGGQVSRRRMLIGLGSVGTLAFVVPTLLMPSQADASGISIYIGPRRRFRRRRYYRRRRRYLRRPRVRGYRRRRLKRRKGRGWSKHRRRYKRRY